MGAMSSGDESTPSKYSQPHLNTGFLSPLANEKSSTNKELGFSPSIFLSRPNDSHTDNMQSSTSSPPSSAPIPIPRSDSISNAEDHDFGESSGHLEQLRPRSSSSGYNSDSCARGGDHLNSSRNGEDFVTSTPIKIDKENLRKRRGSTEDEEGVGWSPTILHNSGRKHLREANDVSLYWMQFLYEMSCPFMLCMCA